MMQIRKAQNLTWWAMVNAAATFTDSGKNLAVYFGMSTSLNTMSTKLKDLIPYDEILLRTKKTLSEYGIGIAIFDKNSQMLTKLKYQTNGKSSLCDDCFDGIEVLKACSTQRHILQVHEP